MKIAVASEGKDENSQVSERGGRAPFYIVFEEKRVSDIIKNPFAVGGGGAGFSVAHMLEGRGVALVIAGKLGENMKSALRDKGIRFFEAQGITVKAAIEAVSRFNQ